LAFEINDKEVTKKKESYQVWSSGYELWINFVSLQARALFWITNCYTISKLWSGQKWLSATMFKF